MKRISKDNQDLQSQRSATTYFGGNNAEDQYAKSFQVGGPSKKFVNVTIPNAQIKGKQFYKKQPYCTICYRNFTTTFRQHHCRFCVNAVCGDCSRSIINKQRACDVCVLRFTNSAQQKKKKQMLQTLQTLCAYLIYQKNEKLAQLERLKSATSQGGNIQKVQEQLKNQQKIIQDLQKQNQGLKGQYRTLQQKLNLVRQRNSQIQNKIAQIQQQMEGHPQLADDRYD